MAGSTLDVPAAVDALSAALAARGTPERAAQERRYLKSELTFFGATLPAIDAVLRAWAADHPDLGHDDLVALAAALWDAPIHERRMAAVKLLVGNERRLGPADLPLVERLIRASRTWAYVDELAACVAGPILARTPDATARLDRWAADPDFWIRRSALLAHLLALRGGEGEFERFARYADAMLDEREVFIRKAIGWVLRDTARKRPDLVYAWALPRAGRMSGVTLREVVRRLPPDQADALRAAAARPRR